MIDVNAERLMADLRELAEFGGVGKGGSRLSYSAEDRAAREWLQGRMQAAGLDAGIDGIGNVYGRMPGCPRSVLVGSHTDTVPGGGWLDGAMGVMYGLEVARALVEGGVRPALGVDVISFQDEEGTYLPLTGSRSFCGELAEEEIDAARSLDGTPLREALRAAGYAGRGRAQLDTGRHAAYLEPHIEQGPRLEAAGRRVGVVTGIVGLRRERVSFEGEANHAGTTPMAMRRDAGAALIRCASDLLSRFRRIAGPETVWNLGHLAVRPGAANIVPEYAEVMVEYRDPAEEKLEEMQRELGRAMEAAGSDGSVSARSAPVAALHPSAMDPGLVDVMERAAKRVGASHMRMASGAGHDAMVLARHVPSAMMFVPSIGGRSHAPTEDTAEEDIVLGARVFAAAVATLIDDSGR